MSIAKNRRQKAIKRSSGASSNRLIRIIDISFSKEMVHFSLSDGRMISTPLSHISFLDKMKPAERKNYKLEGSAAFWDAVDQGISVRHLLAGNYW